MRDTAVHLTIICLGLLGTVRCDDVDQTPATGWGGTRCYDKFRNPQRCIPEFENAAFNVLMEATNTCGDNGPIEFCRQTEISEVKKSCQLCYPNQHHAQYLTDFHNQDEPTWWQSETMMENIQNPNQVNLTLHLGKAFDITYIRLWFYSPRPESFAIYKRTKEDGPWIPYQYYSASCRDTYGLPDTTRTIRGEETRALCKSEYSDISPLTGGNAAFSTLEGRPSAYNFDASPELQEWVTATDIRIILDRLNTFGEEVFGAEQVLRSYFYAIADVAVGARCKCNGHASECISSTGLDGSRRRVCKCEHNTAGPDCNDCLPFYHDAPWRRATAKNAYECKQCNCNGFSTRCYFDQDLYDQTGHGGHCLDCTANRDGPNCERCKENFYMREDGYCVACDCDPVGSKVLQCNSEGKCQCKPGVTGDKCNRCEANHYDFGPHGCKNCGCSEIGSINNTPSCDPYSGTCYCKENVEGKRCRECKPGFFNLDLENSFGCTPCFCYGHSSQCISASGYFKHQIASSFDKSGDRWRTVDENGRPLELEYNALSQSVAFHSLGDEIVYFLAPDRYIGDQRASYNQVLQFSLRIGKNMALPSAADVIIEGAGERIALAIFAQQHNIPSTETQIYRFRLHEHPNYGWEPRLSARAFMSILTNITAIKIKATYSSQDVTYLDDVKLETASRGVASTQPAYWVEQCKCPDGYVGQFCESCATGFRHSRSLSGPFIPCIPCDCNKHTDECDSDTGKCRCQHNTAGDNCEFCARGYYGNALGGTKDDCQPCGCPQGGPCIQIDDENILCTECPEGYGGHRCDSCSDGYFGDPQGKNGARRNCTLCDCNQNIDTNGIGNCDTTTGECLKCIYNTGGPKCDQCLEGYWGNPLASPRGNCQPCQCYPPGTELNPSGLPVCNQVSGFCHCKPHVVGKNCDLCEDGYYNLQSGQGCQTCGCDPIGSLNQTCDIFTGQCLCRPGITGLRCDHCEPRKYGFSVDGCKECDCDKIGSKDLQCDASGQCPCLENVEGRQCDRCKENKYDRQRGCLPCPDCYNLVQDAARSHNKKLAKLKVDLEEIEHRPTVIKDEEFPEELKNLQESINEFHEKVVAATGEDSIIQQVQDIRNREKDISRTLSEIDENVELAIDKSNLASQNISNTEDDLERSEIKLNDLTYAFETEGKTALENAVNRAKIVGQQSEKMTTIAQEARELADKLEGQSNELVKKADEAKNKSSEAYKLAETAYQVQEDTIPNKAKELRNELNNIESNLNKTKQLTETASEKAREAKKEALALLSQVNNLVVPDVDVSIEKVKTEEIKLEANRVKEEVQQIAKDNDDVINDIHEKLFNGEEMLQRVEDQQYVLGQQMSDIELYDIQTTKTVEEAEKLLNSTMETYKVLSDFDKQAQEKKQAAHDALRKVPEIQELIDDAFRKYEEGHKTLEDAKLYSNTALRKAIDANELAKNASSDAEKIKNGAELLHQNTTELSNEAIYMGERLQRTESEFKHLFEQNQANDSLITIAKEKVGIAGRETQEASSKVSELLASVQEIIDELENLPDIDEEALEQLQIKYKMAEDRVKEAKLDEKLANLQKQQDAHNSMIADYEKEIMKLQKDVDNIEQIARALPDGCFNRVELEP
ncbi:hypothetical protein HHI36_020973 [Cryptolaemus montrouzieri]|uniref:Laminin subunit gamma-1 n=1 Tax=Cryptolaemus montrouzieri TaxID=559131 RepID=A0ABD2NBZ9_9CUCU